MLRYFVEYPIVMLIVSAAAAGIFYYLIDHFRTYVLDGSRDPIQVTSLRYVQIFVALLTIALIALILSIVGLAGWLQPGAGIAPPPALTPTPDGMLPETSEPGTPDISGAETPGLPTSTFTPPPPPSPTSAITATIGNTGGAGANMRSIPGMEGAIITSVNEGTQVTVLDNTETLDGFTWQLIILPDGRQGWVVLNYLIFQP
jgi:hypothetical protein